MVQLNLSLQLRGAATAWYDVELSSAAKTILCEAPSMQFWIDALLGRFKPSPALLLQQLEQTHYTRADAAAKRDPVTFFHEILRLTRHDNRPEHKRVTIAYTHFESQLRMNLPPPQFGDTIQGFIEHLEGERNAWYEASIQVHRDLKNKILILEQPQYAEKLLRDHSMDQVTPVSTPIDGYTSIAVAHPEEARADQREYQRRIGSLMYLMIGTRPDLAFAIGKLSQFCIDSTIRHMNALNRVLEYVRGTTYLGLRYQSSGEPIGYSDSAYGDDQEDRKSTYGFAFLCGQAACIWYSRKQRDVCTSTTEAEYVGMSEAGKSIVWATRWLKGLRLMSMNHDPIKLLGDNKGSIHLSKNPEYHRRTKHIDIKYHYIRQLVEDKDLTIDYIPTAQMAADILTKPLNMKLFSECRRLLGMYDCSIKRDRSPQRSVNNPNQFHGKRRDNYPTNPTPNQQAYGQRPSQQQPRALTNRPHLSGPNGTPNYGQPASKPSAYFIDPQQQATYAKYGGQQPSAYTRMVQIRGSNSD